MTILKLVESIYALPVIEFTPAEVVEYQDWLNQKNPPVAELEGKDSWLFCLIAKLFIESDISLSQSL